MTHIISQVKIAEVLGVTENTVSTRMSSAPNWRDGALKFYHTSEVFVWCNKYTRGRAKAILDASDETGELYVGSESIPLGKSFEVAATNLFSDGVNVANRIQHVRNTFTSNLAFCDGSRAYWPHIEALRIKLLLNGGIQRFILLDERESLPEWTAFTPAFALLNSQIGPRELESVLRWAA